MATAGSCLAQEVAEVADPSANTAYILNTLLFLIGGFLVMWMAAGFAMLEAGLVRSKNVSMQCLKNIGLYSIAGIMFWVIGYSIAYPGFEGGFIGIADFPYAMQGVGEADVDTGYSVASDWFFQMVFCATTASIVSGTVAERVKVIPFCHFRVCADRVHLSLIVSWEWGAGWLDAMGFSDFRRFYAGSLDWRLGGSGWCPDRRTSSRTLCEWQGYRHARFKHSVGDPRYVHPVARLVRFQRCVAARNGHDH